MPVLETVALTTAVGWGSGINLYATVFMLGLLSQTGHLTLPPDLQILADPLVMAAAGLMYCVEFFADKTPGVDSGWDAIHTFIRIPAGAALAMGAVGEVDPAVQVAALLLGGSLAATSHAAKAGARVLINTSPEPFSNWTASITEDLAVIGAMWAALNHPWLFLTALGLFLLLMVWLLPKLWRGIKRLFAAVGRLFSGRGSQVPVLPDKGP